MHEFFYSHKREYIRTLLTQASLNQIYIPLSIVVKLNIIVDTSLSIKQHLLVFG